MQTIKIGDTVMTRWGLSEIKKIEICPKPGDKYGLPTEEVYVDLVDRCIFDFECQKKCVHFFNTTKK